MTIVGIDVSKAWLDVAMLGALPTTSRVANTPDGIASFVAQLTALAPTRIGIEATGAYHLPLLAALLSARLPVSLLNPAQIHAYRQVRAVRNKTDRQDARLIAHFTQTHLDDLRLARPVTPLQARLRALVTYRDGRVGERTRLRNQREAATWAASAEVLALLADDLAHVEAQLASVDRAIAAVLADLPEAAVLRQLTGVGPQVVATVLAYLPVELWGQVKPAVAYAGVHPQQAQSGRTSHTRLSKAGPPQLRRVLYVSALVAIRHDDDLRRRYEAFLARGKPPKAARCAIMHAQLRRMMGTLKAYYRQQAALAVTDPLPVGHDPLPVAA
jgi:transposase